MLKRLFSATALLLLAGCASAVPPDREFNASAPFALAVIETEPSAPLLRPGGTYDLVVVPFDPQAGKFIGGGRAEFEPMHATAQRRFYVGRFHPGPHAFMKIQHNLRFNGCFNGGTQHLTVQPGQVLFLGRLDPRPTLAAMAAGLPSSSAGTPFTVFDTQLNLTPPEAIPGWETAVSAFLSERYPGRNLTARAAQYRPATFQAARNIMAERVCG